MSNARVTRLLWKLGMSVELHPFRTRYVAGCLNGNSSGVGPPHSTLYGIVFKKHGCKQKRKCKTFLCDVAGEGGGNPHNNFAQNSGQVDEGLGARFLFPKNISKTDEADGLNTGTSGPAPPRVDVRCPLCAGRFVAQRSVSAPRVPGSRSAARAARIRTPFMFTLRGSLAYRQSKHKHPPAAAASHPGRICGRIATADAHCSSSALFSTVE